MPLITCPECNKQIFDEVDNCPHCGHPITMKNDPSKEKIKTLRVKCPKCQKTFTIEREMLGQRINCSNCDQCIFIDEKVRDPQQQIIKNKNLPLWCIISGIISLLLLFFSWRLSLISVIFPIVTGHMFFEKKKRSDIKSSEKTKTLIGLVSGYITIIILNIILYSSITDKIDSVFSTGRDEKIKSEQENMESSNIEQRHHKWYRKAAEQRNTQAKKKNFSLRYNIITNMLLNTSIKPNKFNSKPFGFQLTPGVPTGFNDLPWGATVEDVKKKLGKNFEAEIEPHGVGLTINEEDRTIKYFIHEKCSLFAVGITYYSTKPEVIIKEFVQKFGKIPQENVVEKYGSLEMHWLGNKTHIVCSIPKRGHEVEIVFEDRKILNNGWRSELLNFLVSTLGEFGKTPFFPGLHWGMTLKEAFDIKGENSLMTSSDDETNYYSNGTCHYKTFFNDGGIGGLIFNNNNKLSACYMQFEERKGQLTLEKLITLLGLGKQYIPQKIPPKSKLVLAKEWYTFPNILVRCVVLQYSDNRILVCVSYGQRNFLQNYDYLVEEVLKHAQENEKLFKF